MPDAVSTGCAQNEDPEFEGIKTQSPMTNSNVISAQNEDPEFEGIKTLRRSGLFPVG